MLVFVVVESGVYGCGSSAGTGRSHCEKPFSGAPAVHQRCHSPIIKKSGNLTNVKMWLINT